MIKLHSKMHIFNWNTAYANLIGHLNHGGFSVLWLFDLRIFCKRETFMIGTIKHSECSTTMGVTHVLFRDSFPESLSNTQLRIMHCIFVLRHTLSNYHLSCWGGLWNTPFQPIYPLQRYVPLIWRVFWLMKSVHILGRGHIPLIRFWN